MKEVLRKMHASGPGSSRLETWVTMERAGNPGRRATRFAYLAFGTRPRR